LRIRVTHSPRSALGGSGFRVRGTHFEFRVQSQIFLEIIFRNNFV